uniref:PNPLA domain-containing protein n=1 Tax=viral metagenome TaxID=1070528 RepID=A0A6C0DIP7_9ZZZZ
MKNTFLLLFLQYTIVTCGRIVGNIVKQNKLMGSQQCIVSNKNNLVYCEKEREIFLEENNFIKNKKLISISPGGVKGFYELGILSFIKDNYDMENYIFSGASAGSWNALFMCYNNDTKKFIYNLLEHKLSQVKSISELEYVLKYNILSNYNSDDFDLRRLYIGVTTLQNFKPKTNIFSDFTNLEDAINCCIASSHIPFVTGGLTNRYHNMYTFDGGFSDYPYLNFSENVLHITPSMWKTLNIDNNKNIRNLFSKLNVLYNLFTITKNNNYIRLFDDGYQDAKENKHVLDDIFTHKTKNEIDNDNSAENATENKDETNNEKHDNSETYWIYYKGDNDSY